MIEYWVSWTHRNGDGHGNVLATAFESFDEREKTIANEHLWPVGHTPHLFWETQEGVVT